MNSPKNRTAPAGSATSTNPVPISLRLEGLEIRRGRDSILKGIDWTVRSGEHWVMLGANGSGKTSLLRALTGYFMPSAGEIYVFDQRYGYTDWREVRLHVGIVSSAVQQLMNDAEPALYTVLSGKYAAIDYRQRPKPAEKTQAQALLEQMECGQLAARPWGVLSQGERQRVLIARALMSSPVVLILDEPCAGLDPGARELFLRFLERLGTRKAAPTLVLVTHHVEEIMPVFSHVLLLHEGRVLAAGPHRQVMSSRNLSALFSSRAQLRYRHRRYSLTIKAPPAA